MTAQKKFDFFLHFEKFVLLSSKKVIAKKYLLLICDSKVKFNGIYSFKFFVSCIHVDCDKKNEKQIILSDLIQKTNSAIKCQEKNKYLK